MQVEQLQERITFKKLIKTKQANGEVTTSLSDLVTVWARAMPVSGTESFEGDQKTRTEKMNFLVRHRTDIGTTNIIGWDGRDWDIVSINPYFKEGRNNFKLIRTEYAGGQY